MPVFRLKRFYLEALKSGRKKGEIRVGKMWLKIAQKIQAGELKPIAIFKSGDEMLVYEISRIEIYPNAVKALKNKRWKALGIEGKNLKEAIKNLKKMYPKLPLRPAVIFWVRPPSKNLERIIELELKRTGETKLLKNFKQSDRSNNL